MDTYHTFLACDREATSYLTSDHKVFLAAEGKPCGSFENSNLFLCDSCLDYWKECTENHLLAGWEFALERRRSAQRERQFYRSMGS